MITFNEGNILDINNECGTFNLEDDIKDGMSLLINNKNMALSMLALYTNDEIKHFLANRDHCIIKSSLKGQRIGYKKVLETIFTTKSFDENDEDFITYRIILTSEDTRYEYTLSEEEWTQMIKLMEWVSNGYRKLE